MFERATIEIKHCFVSLNFNCISVLFQLRELYHAGDKLGNSYPVSDLTSHCHGKKPSWKTFRASAYQHSRGGVVNIDRLRSYACITERNF